MTYEIFLLTLHVLGAGVVIGSTIMALVSVWKKPVTMEWLGRIRFVGEFAKWGGVWQLLTGILLYMREPNEFSAKPIFWIKLGLFVLQAVLASVFLGRQGKKLGQQLQSGQASPNPIGLAGTITFVTLSVVFMASIGVFLVSAK